MKKLILGIFVFFLVVFAINVIDQSSSPSNSSSSSNKEAILKGKLNYLNDIEDISWWEVDGNDVYINFNDLSFNYKATIRMAATLGNRATDFGVHVWALNGKQRGWRPGDSDYLDNATARYGKLQ
jgi:hypothetical protein